MLEVIVASYLQIKNANQNVIIDDTYKNATFVGKAKRVGGETSNPFKNVSVNPNPNENYVPWDYRKSIYIEGSAYDLGFTESVLSNDPLLLLFVRCNTSDAFYCTPLTCEKQASGLWRIGTFAYSNVANLTIEITVYTYSQRIDSKYGKIAYNANGEKVFDAARGVLTNVGLLYGTVDLSQQIAQTYLLTMPIDIDVSNLFISMRSSFPLRSSYSINSGGVTFTSSRFFPVMTRVASNQLKVELVRNNNGGGSNVVAAVGGFSENIIYCTYPFSP